MDADSENRLTEIMLIKGMHYYIRIKNRQGFGSSGGDDCFPDHTGKNLLLGGVLPRFTVPFQLISSPMPASYRRITVRTSYVFSP